MTHACEQARPETEWAEQIPDEQWAIYERVIDAASRAGLRFLLGGAFSLAAYTGDWRNTKDLDFFILPEERDRMVRILTDLELRDYYDQLPYERHWIYRAVADDTIVDAIWQMANHRAAVDESWFTHAPWLRIRGREVAVLSIEELIWTKIYVIQRDRCDWPDLVNVLHRAGCALDWERLLYRLSEDAPLLAALLTIFRWLCPGHAGEFPGWIWERLGLAPPPENAPSVEPHRACLLDTRNWFGPILAPEG